MSLPEQSRVGELIAANLRQPAHDFILQPYNKGWSVKQGTNITQPLLFREAGASYPRNYRAEIIDYSDAIHRFDLDTGNLALLPALEEGEYMEFSNGPKNVSVIRMGENYVVRSFATINGTEVPVTLTSFPQNRKDPFVIPIDSNAESGFAVTPFEHDGEQVLVIENLSKTDQRLTVKPSKHAYERVHAMADVGSIFPGNLKHPDITLPYEDIASRGVQGLERNREELENAVWPAEPFVGQNGRPKKSLQDHSHDFLTNTTRIGRSQEVIPDTSRNVYATLAAQHISPVFRDTAINGGAVWQPTPDAVIVVNDKDPQQGILRTRYGQLISRIGKQTDPLQVMQIVGNFVGEKMTYNKMTRDFIINNTYFQQGQDGIVPLATYVEGECGTEREMIIFAAYLLEKLTRQGFIKGKVSLDTNSVPRSGEVSEFNTWVRFTNEQGDVFLLDFYLDRAGLQVETLVASLSEAQQRLRWNYARPEELENYPVGLSHQGSKELLQKPLLGN